MREKSSDLVSVVTVCHTLLDVTTRPKGRSEAKRHHGRWELLQDSGRLLRSLGGEMDCNEAVYLEAQWLRINYINTVHAGGEALFHRKVKQIKRISSHMQTLRKASHHVVYVI